MVELPDHALSLDGNGHGAAVAQTESAPEGERHRLVVPDAEQAHDIRLEIRERKGALQLLHAHVQFDGDVHAASPKLLRLNGELGELQLLDLTRVAAAVDEQVEALENSWRFDIHSIHPPMRTAGTDRSGSGP